MFCPICKSEYREGFYTCSDCHVDLVAQLPEPDAPTAFAVLWSGESAAFQDRLLEELGREGIGAAGIPRDLLFRNSTNMLGARLEPRFGLAVCIRNSDAPAARPILEKLLDEHPEEISFSAQPLDMSPSEADIIPELPLHWNSSAATVNVWEGTDPERLDFLVLGVFGVWVPTLRNPAESGGFQILVRPQDESRAREVLGQIETNTAPQEELPQQDRYVWLDEPVRSYRLLWICGALFLCFFLISLRFDVPIGPSSFLGPLFGLGALATDLGVIWMLYQAIRYEIRPLQFIIFALVIPFSFVWYYFERYSKRTGIRRLPVAMRVRMSPPTSA